MLNSGAKFRTEWQLICTRCAPFPRRLCVNLTTTVDYKLGGPSPSPVLHVSTLLFIRKTHWILVIGDSKYIAQLRYRSFNQLCLKYPHRGGMWTGLLIVDPVHEKANILSSMHVTRQMFFSFYSSRAEITMGVVLNRCLVKLRGVFTNRKIFQEESSFWFKRRNRSQERQSLFSLLEQKWC